MTARCAQASRCWARRGQSWAHNNVRKDQDENEEEPGGGGGAMDAQRLFGG